MAEFIELVGLTFGGGHALAKVRIADGAPVRTADDLEATAHVYYVMPGIADHACKDDGGETFKEVMGDTDVAHLLEHATIELMALTNLAGNASCGRTRQVPGDDERLYEIELDAPDDVLVASALSSAAWILGWAFTGAADPAPDVNGIVAGISGLVAAANEAAPDPQYPDIEKEIEGEIDAVAESDEAPYDEVEVDEEEVVEPGPEPDEEEVEGSETVSEAPHHTEIHLGNEVGFMGDVD